MPGSRSPRPLLPATTAQRSTAPAKRVLCSCFRRCHLHRRTVGRGGHCWHWCARVPTPAPAPGRFLCRSSWPPPCRSISLKRRRICGRPSYTLTRTTAAPSAGRSCARRSRLGVRAEGFSGQRGTCGIGSWVAGRSRCEAGPHAAEGWFHPLGGPGPPARPPIHPCSQALRAAWTQR